MQIFLTKFSLEKNGGQKVRVALEKRTLIGKNKPPHGNQESHRGYKPNVFRKEYTMNMFQNLDLNYCPLPPPPLPVFEEELFVFNACPTRKFTKFQKCHTDKDGKIHKYVNRFISHTTKLKKDGSSKIYKVHFRGNFYHFSELMVLLADYGLTWMRNRWWYRNEETGENYHPSNFLLVDFDDLGIITGAELMEYDYDHVDSCLAIESSSNETVFSFKEEFIEEIGDNVGRFEADKFNGKTKFHVFLNTEPFSYDNETLRQKVTEETSYIFSHEGVSPNTAIEARKKQKKGLPLTIADEYALETAWDPQAAYVTQKTFSVLNPSLLDKYPERFRLSYQAEREIGLVYTLNDFPSIFKGLAEYVTVEPLLQFPQSTPTTKKNSRIKEQQVITENLLEAIPPEIHPPQSTPTGVRNPRIKGQQVITDFKTWFGKRELRSEAPFMLLSASRILKEIVDRNNLPREASYPIAHWENTYPKQNKVNRIRIGSRHKMVDLQIIVLCYNARALASYFNIDLDTDSTLSYDGIIRQVNWIVRKTTEDSGADEKDPMNFKWIAQKVYQWLFVATTEEMAEALSTSKLKMYPRIIPNWDINLDEFGQLCSLKDITKEECFKAAEAKWRISKAVFNGLWRRAGIAQKQAHRPRTRRSKSKAPSADESPVKGA